VLKKHSWENIEHGEVNLQMKRAWIRTQGNGSN